MVGVQFHPESILTEYGHEMLRNFLQIEAGDFGPLIAESGARGFIAKAELSGAGLAALLE